MGFFKRISTTFKTDKNTASDKAEDSDEMSNQIMVDKQERLVTTKQQIATHLSQGDPIEKLNLTEYSFNALTSAGIQTVGKLLKLVELGELRAIHSLKSTSILEIEDELARVPALDDAGVDANSGATSTQNDVSFSQADSTEEPSLPQHSPNPPIHTERQTVGEGTQHTESSDIQTTSEGEADTNETSDQNDVPLSTEDSTKKIKLTRDALNRLKQTDIRTVGELVQWVESGESQTIAGAEANTNETSDQNDVSLSREDSTEEPSLTQYTDSRTVGGDKRKVKSSEPPTISEVEADADVIPSQNDMYLSRGDAIEKLNLSRPSFNVLTGIGIRTVGEVLQLFESARPNMIRQAFGRNFTLEIRAKLAQVTVLDDSETEANANTTPEQNDVSFSREASTEEQSSTQHTNLRAVREGNQQVESDELSTISETEADTNETSDQNDVPLSTEDSIEKLNLTEYSFDALTALGVQTVGEVLELVESDEHRPISTLGRKFITEIEGKLAQAKILDDSETEANTDSQTVGEAVQPAESGELQITAEDEANSDIMPDKDKLSLSREDSTEEPSLPQHSPNPSIHTESQTVVEIAQQVESGEIQTISETEVNTNTILEQNDVYLSRGDAIEKLNLSQRSLKALKRADIRMVGELLQLVELGKIRVTRGLGRKSIPEIEKKLAQVKIYDNYIHLSREDSITQLYLRNRSFNALTHAGVQTIGEALQLVESDGLERIPALGRKSIIEIKNKLAQVATLNDSEGEVNTNSIIDRNYVHLSLEDPIEQLNLTPRSFNALTRAKIRTIGEVLQLVESDGLKTLRGLGRKSIIEIKEKVIQAKSLSDSEVEANTDTIPRVVVRWQSELVNKQLSRGLLHEEAIIAEKPIKDWLVGIETTENNRVYEVLATILGSSLNVCEEIEFFLNQIPGQSRMTVLISTYGLEPKNLRQTGEELDLSRERVRQIRSELKDKAISISNLKAKPYLLRTQSALLIAGDLGLDITYEQWTQRIRSSGLVGDWTSQDFAGTDAVEVMIAICNLLADCKIHWLQIPENLQYAVQLAAKGKPNVPSKIPHKLENLPDEIKRLINGHTKNSGGVHVRWLSQESGLELAEIKDILQWLGYKTLSEDWFVSNPSQTSYHDVFHRCARKMFQYCGPLNIDDVCAGLRHLLSRKHVVLSKRREFPVPPPDVMAEIINIHGYKCEDELYYWEGAYDENLNEGEKIIMDCLKQIGPVLHHSELVHAFIASDMSFPLLHATLNYSPLFERIESGLYKLRGKKITYQDIERAKTTGEQQPLRPEIEYDTNGNIIVSVTLSAIAVGSGTILCERFPDLSGANWECYVNGEEAGELNAVENEFRRLKKPFELLNCQPGERVKFTFNTWERTVEIEKEEGNGKD